MNPSTAQTIDVGGKVSFTATVEPNDAVNKKVKWSTNNSNVALYSNEACTTPVGTDVTDTLTVYAKGVSAGSATITVTATNGTDVTTDDKSASCAVTVNVPTEPATEAPTEAPTEASYTVTWKNWNGEELETDTNVAKDALPSYDGEAPTRPDDANNTYTFAAWDDGTTTYMIGVDDLPPVTGDVTYTAVYTAEPKATEAPTEAPDTYIVAGNDTTIFGTSWNGNDTNNTMTFSNDVWSKEYTVDGAKKEVQLKAVKNGSAWIGDETGNNVTFNLSGAGTFTVYCDGAKTWVDGDIVTYDDGLTVDSVTAVGNGTPDGDNWLNNIEWDPAASANHMTILSAGLYEIEYTLGDYDTSDPEFKFAINDAWTHNFGLADGGVIANGVETDTIYNGPQNIKITGLTSGTTIKMYLDLTEFNFETKTGAKMTITWTEPAPTETPTYTVTWKNGDTVLETDENVAQGTMPEYNGTTPEKDEDDDFTYEFMGWSDENGVYNPDALPPVSGDATYTALYYSYPKYTAGYYIIGTMTDWKINDAYMLTPNNNNTESTEYMFEDFSINMGDMFKVVYAEAGKDKIWYPEGMGNNYGENGEFTTGGYYTVYFRPDGDGGEDWFYNCIYVVCTMTDAAMLVNGQINVLPEAEDVTLNDKAAVEAARADYDALSDADKAFVDPDLLQKLTDVEAALASLEAVAAVTAQITALPENITLENKADVEAARQAYDALTDVQKEMIDADTYTKLTDAEDTIAAAEVTALIEALSETITLDDKDDVAAARQAYDALTDDQKNLIDSETVNKLTAAETVIADREAAKAVEDMINALPEQITSENKQTFTNVSSAFIGLSHAQSEYLSEEASNKINNVLLANYFVTGTDLLPEEITLDNKQEVTDLRSYYDDSNDDVKALISDEYMNKLVSAEQTIANIEAANAVNELIYNLPDEIELDDKPDVEAARAAYNALTDDQKNLIDSETLNKLTAAETVIADREAAKAVEDQINALPAVEDITLADKAAVDAANAARLNLTPAQADYLTFSAIDKLFKAQDMIRDLEAAKAVEDQINALPAVEDITLADKDDVQAANSAFLALTNDQIYLLDGDLFDKLEAAKRKIADLEAAKAVTDKINALPTDVTVDDEEQIDAARQAYEALTDDQKALVTPETLEKLTDAETTLDNIVLLGDVDGDGEVTSVDATMIQRYLVSMRNLSDKQIKAADIDGDGEVTILDVTLIQRFLAGIIVKYPINEYV